MSFESINDVARIKLRKYSNGKGEIRYEAVEVADPTRSGGIKLESTMWGRAHSKAGPRSRYQSFFANNSAIQLEFHSYHTNLPFKRDLTPA